MRSSLRTTYTLYSIKESNRITLNDQPAAKARDVGSSITGTNIILGVIDYPKYDIMMKSVNYFVILVI